MRSTWHGPSKQRRAVPGRLWHLKSECRLVTDDVLSRVSSQGFTLRLLSNELVNCNGHLVAYLMVFQNLSSACAELKCALRLTR